VGGLALIWVKPAGHVRSGSILLKKSFMARMPIFKGLPMPLDAVGCGGATSIYARLLTDLPSLAAKAFIAKVRPELISARFLLPRYFRLFQQYRSN
jgi:hypothetical protein